MFLEHFGKTDLGRKRQKNEDRFLINERLHLYLVADGMGGHVGGELASRLAVETIEKVIEEFEEHPEGSKEGKDSMKAGDFKSWLSHAIRLAGKRIYEKACEEPKFQGMGTTTVMFLFREDKVYIGNVGDSRGYRIRANKMEQLTTDHSLVGEQIRAGILKPREAKEHRLKNIITRSVGFLDEVEADTWVKLVKKDDVYLLCSDGLYNLIEDSEILEVIRGHDLKTACNHLVDIANSRGGDDNISVVLVKVHSVGENSEEEEEATEAL